MSEEKGIEPVETVDDERDDTIGGGPPEHDSMEVEIVSFGDEGEEHDPEADPSVDEAVDEAIEALRRELAEERERGLRLRADFDNFRKRSARERDEFARRVLADPIRDLLPVLDNLERALGAPGDGDDFRNGVELIAKQFVDTLKKFGLAEIPALGLPFDPEVHEAVARVESDEIEVATVLDEYQRGYWLNERLLRPAIVRVAVPARGRGGAAETDAADGGEDAS